MFIHMYIVFVWRAVYYPSQREGGESSYRGIYDFHLAIWNVCALGQ